MLYCSMVVYHLVKRINLCYLRLFSVLFSKQIKKHFLLLIPTSSSLCNQRYSKSSLLVSSFLSVTVSSCSFFPSLILSKQQKSTQECLIQVRKPRTDCKGLCCSLPLFHSEFFCFTFNTTYLTFILTAFLNSILCNKIILVKEHYFRPKKF